MPYSSRPRKISGSAIVLRSWISSSKIIPIECRGIINREAFRDHCFDNLDPSIRRKVAKGDILVVGRKFASGEPGEENVMALMELGFSAVVAESVNRLFLRNAINLGFPIIILPIAIEMINDGDILEIDIYDALVRDITRGLAAKGTRLPSVYQRILESGGIVNDVKAGSERKKINK